MVLGLTAAGLKALGGGCFATRAVAFLGGGAVGVGKLLVATLLDFLVRGLSLTCAARSASASFFCSACCAIAVQVLSMIVRSKTSCASASANSKSLIAISYSYIFSVGVATRLMIHLPNPARSLSLAKLIASSSSPLITACWRTAKVSINSSCEPSSIALAPFPLRVKVLLP